MTTHNDQYSLYKKQKKIPLNKVNWNEHQKVNTNTLRYTTKQMPVQT